MIWWLIVALFWALIAAGNIYNARMIRVHRKLQSLVVRTKPVEIQEEIPKESFKQLIADGEYDLLRTHLAITDCYLQEWQYRLDLLDDIRDNAKKNAKRLHFSMDELFSDIEHRLNMTLELERYDTELKHFT